MRCYIASPKRRDCYVVQRAEKQKLGGEKKLGVASHRRSSG
jgi:hypothetical protein